MSSYFSIRAPSPSQADALRSESLVLNPFNLCNTLLHHRYRILKPLGQGGFGKTFLARDEQNFDSFCVVKQLFLRSYTNHHPRSSELLQQEAQRLAALGEHPQMPQLLDTFEQDGQLFIVQEWIDGWTLEQEVAGKVPFDEVEVWVLLRELLPVLQHLHDRQIIHRDIKPANIIRRRSSHPTTSPRKGGRGNLVLVDFGAAKQVGDERQVGDKRQFGAERSLDIGTSMGSAEYAAPEQILGRAVFSSDLYSLGLTCLYLLTQMSPFDLYDMGEATWKWKAYLTQPISPSLKQILCTLLQPVTRRRYQSAADVLAALDELCIQAHKPLTQVAHKPSTRVDSAIAPTALVETEHSFTTSQRASDDSSPAAIAAINTVRTASSIAAATVYSPQTQRWHYITPETETADAAYKAALCPDSHLADATATSHRWKHQSPLVCNPAKRRQTPRRQTPIGWRLFAVGIGTAVASLAMTCLLLCVSIIFLALTMPPHSSATPSQADPSEVLR